LSVIDHYFILANAVRSDAIELATSFC